MKSVDELFAIHNTRKTCNKGQRSLKSWKHCAVNFYASAFHALCNVKDEQVTFWISFYLWRTLAHYERANSMLLRCHGFKEIGSLFVCGAASIQLAHKEPETRRGLRESSLCRVEGKGGWEKNCFGASAFSDPNWNYKCIWEMSYLWWAAP